MSHNINLPTTGDNFKIKANNSDILTIAGTGTITTTNGTSTSTHKVGEVTLNANQTGTDISGLDFTGLETFTIRAKVTEDIEIASYSVANPSEVTTTYDHGLSNGDSIYINGAANLANAAYTVTVASSTIFTTTPAIDNSTINATGGNASRYAYFTMHGLNKSTGGNEWIMTTNYIGDTLGISFSIDIDSLFYQIEYTTDTNHAGSMIYEMVSNIN